MWELTDRQPTILQRCRCMMWNMDVCPTKHWNCADWLDACLVWRSCDCAANKSLTIFCLKLRFMSSFSIFLSSTAMNLLKTVASSSSTGFAWLSAFCPSKNWLMVASPLSTVCSSAAYNVYTHAPTATQSIHQYDHTAVWYNWKCSIITSRHITLVSLWAGSSVSSAGWCAPVLCSNTLWHLTLVHPKSQFPLVRVQRTGSVSLPYSGSQQMSHRV